MPPARQDSRTPTPTNMKATWYPLIPGALVFLGNFCAAASHTVRASAAALHRGDRRTYSSSPPMGVSL